jgi:hypothetical protein
VNELYEIVTSIKGEVGWEDLMQNIFDGQERSIPGAGIGIGAGSRVWAIQPVRGLWG